MIFVANYIQKLEILIINSENIVVNRLLMSFYNIINITNELTKYPENDKNI